MTATVSPIIAAVHARCAERKALLTRHVTTTAMFHGAAAGKSRADDRLQPEDDPVLPVRLRDTSDRNRRLCVGANWEVVVLTGNTTALITSDPSSESSSDPQKSKVAEAQRARRNRGSQHVVCGWWPCDEQTANVSADSIALRFDGSVEQQLRIDCRHVAGPGLS